MKEFMRIVENAMRAPAWFQHAPVVDVNDEDAFSDASFILDPHEFDYEWRLCQVPAGAFHQIVGGPDFATWFKSICPSESRESEAARIREIEKWMGDDPAAALRSSPLIAMIHPATSSFDLVDGHHRAAIAIHKMGLDALPCIVALADQNRDPDAE